MTYHHYYDPDGKPIDRDTWACLYEVGENRRVIQTVVRGFGVSTVWLGLNHNFMEGPPLIFETMVFRGAADFAGVDEDSYTRRYSTRLQALEGHAEVMAELEAKLQTGEPIDMDAEVDAWRRKV